VGKDNHNVNTVDHNAEIDILKKESSLSLNDVINQLPEGYLESKTDILKEVLYWYAY